MKTYKGITKEKDLQIIGYQNQFFGKKIWENAINPLVLAAGTSAGKTITSLISLEIFYSDSKNKNKRTLVVPASKTVLRDNYSIELEKFNPNFGYFVATNKKELEEAIKDNSYQVIIALPQTISRNYKLLPKIHNFILDEAHQWYFKNTIQTIIKHIKPTKQLLLTGTPSRFIAKGNGFDFFFVPVMDLYNEDRVSNIKIEVVSSSYDFKQKDYLSNYGNLKSSKTNSAKEAKDALSMVCDEMILKLRSRLGNKYLSNLRGANKISSLFNDLDKTIIFCHSVKQSNAFFKELNSMKGLKDKVLVSHSDNDKDSEYFEMFRTQSEYKVLVAVDRGKLGYNLPDLFNVVDFTLTQSLDMILQMMGRILRLSDKDKQKTYFKVATKNTAGYFVDLMTGALCLFTNDSPTYYYSSFNGKNMGGILIPKVLTKSTKSGQKSTQSTNGKKGTQQLKSLEELGIPLDLNLFKQDIMYSQSDKFGTIAWTTLDDVRREFFDVNQDCVKKGYTKEYLVSIAKKYKHIKDLRVKEKGIYFAIRRMGIENEAFQHMNKLWSEKTEKDLYEFIKKNKIKTKTDLWDKGGQWFRVAERFEIDIDKILPNKYNKDWTKERITKVAKEYTDLTTFYRELPSAYRNAKKLGILDDISKHMNKPKRNTPYTKKDIPELI
jgi:superfamily II DNA or RNA helicase